MSILTARNLKALLIAAFGMASILGLTATILGVQAYFDHIYEQEMYQKVMVPVVGRSSESPGSGRSGTQQLQVSRSQQRSGADSYPARHAIDRAKKRQTAS